ncbi:MAG TPA: prepilin-type N-terminal cleavage/methylation domain-containing protein [Thermoleophilaceae bacterium]|jgi:prepilin-type N-terminal cleavage/methylation domain-containing protein
MSQLAQLRKSDGFTLMELVVAMAIGMVILLAAFTVIDRAFFTNNTIKDREDSLQRGRVVLEQMTRQLRSLVCVNNTNAVTAATDSSMSFYTYLGDPTLAATQLPEWHTLTLAGGTISEQDYKITSTSPITVAATPYRTVKLTNATLAKDPDNPTQTLPLFRYYKYDPTQQGTGALIQLGTPVSPSDQGVLADVKLSFVVSPTGRSSVTPQSTTYSDDVLWRSPDPDKPATVPCAPSS